MRSKEKTRWEEKIYSREISLYGHNYTKYFTVGLPWQWKICLHCKRPWFNPWVRKIPWRREWQPTPVFLPGESHGQRSLVGYRPCGSKESGMTEQLTLLLYFFFFFHFTLLIPLIFSVWLSATPWTVPVRLLHPWDFLGKITGVGCHFLLQGIVPTQGLNPGLLHCRQALYHLSLKGASKSLFLYA